MSSPQAANEKPPIFVDARSLNDDHLGGIGRYTARLVHTIGLRQQVSVLIDSSFERPDMQRSGACTRIVLTPSMLSSVGRIDRDLEGWRRRMLALPRGKVDVGELRHATVVYPSLRPPCRIFGYEIAIFHDFTPFIVPWAHASATVHHFGQFFIKSAKLCDRIISVSESTRFDARWLSTVPPDRVVAIYPGASICVQEHASRQPRERSRVISVVSTLEPRKNAAFLIDWFLASSHIEAGTELWWAGPQGWMATAELAELQEKAGAREDRKIRWLGKVKDSEICDLYKRSMVTAYPSLYEGFGFPVLDSLRHGAPVLASFNSSLSEFIGPGVFFFDPCDRRTLDAAYQAFIESRAGAPLDPAALDERYSWDIVARTIVELATTRPD